MRRARLWILLVLPLALTAQDAVTPDAPARKDTAWARLTDWLGPRRNPYRTTVSDIVERGRRSPFMPPSVEKPVPPPDPTEVELTGPAARRFMLTAERELDALQQSLRAQNWGAAVAQGRDLIETLESHRLDEEHQLRRNEILAEVRRTIEAAADELEKEGMAEAERNLELAREAFAAGDWKGVREAQARIGAFVDSWQFRDQANAARAGRLGEDAADLVRRVVIREEFAAMSFKVGFLVISESGPSTVVLNGKSVKEGESFGPELKIKDIDRDRILFTYKGEEISWNLETP